MRGHLTAVLAAACATLFMLAAGTASAGSHTPSGTFTGASDHVTAGGVTIVTTAGGGAIVILDTDFSLDGAPDPRVCLGKDGVYDETSDLANSPTGRACRPMSSRLAWMSRRTMKSTFGVGSTAYRSGWHCSNNPGSVRGHGLRHRGECDLWICDRRRSVGSAAGVSRQKVRSQVPDPCALEPPRGPSPWIWPG